MSDNLEEGKQNSYSKAFVADVTSFISLSMWAGPTELGGQGGHWPPKNFSDQIKFCFHKALDWIKVL